MKNLLFILLFAETLAHAANIIPIGNENNSFYYKIGGANDYALPPVSDTERISLDTNTNLGLGYSCTSYNPALSIVNSMNNIKHSVDNLDKDIIENATASLIAIPGYVIAKNNPTLYALFNNQLLSSHKELSVSTKNCQAIKAQMSQGQNPYQDWGTIAVNDQWKKKLSFAAAGDMDINQAKKDIDKTSGDDGVSWVNGKKDNDGSRHAGGKGQPAVHVIADTVQAGYNAILNRSLESNEPAPVSGSSSELARIFPSPSTAMDWITNVVGDEIISTCNEDSCKKIQGSLIGHGLLPEVTSCNHDKENCVDSINEKLGRLVSGKETINKTNLEKVSADGILISPEVIAAIRRMEPTQQSIIMHKLAQEVAIERIIDKAFMAKNILATGAQVPVIAANHPAQVIINQAIAHLDADIRSFTFESQMRKQMVSGTLSEVLHFSNQQQDHAMTIGAVSSTAPIMTNGALPQQRRNP